MFSGVVLLGTAGTSLWFPRPSDLDTPIKLLDCLPIIREVCLAIEFAVRELARVVFVFGHLVITKINGF